MVIGAAIGGSCQKGMARMAQRFSMTDQPGQQDEALLTPSEVATMFRVDPKTVTRWAKAGRLTSIRTLGGHRRYRRAECVHLMNASVEQRVE